MHKDLASNSIKHKFTGFCLVLFLNQKLKKFSLVDTEKSVLDLIIGIHLKSCYTFFQILTLTERPNENVLLLEFV